MTASQPCSGVQICWCQCHPAGNKEHERLDIIVSNTLLFVGSHLTNYNRLHRSNDCNSFANIGVGELPSHPAVQASAAYLRLSCGGLNRLSTMLWPPEYPSWYRNSSVFRCLTSRHEWRTVPPSIRDTVLIVACVCANIFSLSRSVSSPSNSFLSKDCTLGRTNNLDTLLDRCQRASLIVSSTYISTVITKLNTGSTYISTEIGSELALSAKTSL